MYLCGNKIIKKILILLIFMPILNVNAASWKPLDVEPNNNLSFINTGGKSYVDTDSVVVKNGYIYAVMKSDLPFQNSILSYLKIDPLENVYYILHMTDYNNVNYIDNIFKYDTFNKNHEHPISSGNGVFAIRELYSNSRDPLFNVNMNATIKNINLYQNYENKIKQYNENIYRIIYNNWNKPKPVTNKFYYVKFFIKVKKDGTAFLCIVQKPVDDKVKESIKYAVEKSKLPPLPESVDLDYIYLQMSFSL